MAFPGAKTHKGPTRFHMPFDPTRSADSLGFLLSLLAFVMCSICPFPVAKTHTDKSDPGLADFGFLGPERPRFENSMDCTKIQTPRPILSSTRAYSVFLGPTRKIKKINLRPLKVCPEGSLRSYFGSSAQRSLFHGSLP